ncbi:ribulose bisphosphate carboxylase/oxygenase activase 1, chloroplastic-like [Solanum verrucosum]|uniref:ribulose bisphosphate carboxylase/oxygenase activase 1, chloroplastic-like n=1 Tax=Solanum verrucosum TaxID=315347 RepID=UPI0020D1A6F7|nr:ribulose bisphosphate carboxylase/oxygenase activase 1, chloroplastic-like [Solanum verrucosum]
MATSVSTIGAVNKFEQLCCWNFSSTNSLLWENLKESEQHSFQHKHLKQDIARGKGMVDSLFQAPTGTGTHHAIMNSYEYLSQGLRQYNLDNKLDGFYITPAFMDKLVVHITKNFLTLPDISRFHLFWVFGEEKVKVNHSNVSLSSERLGINPIMMSAGELESGNAGEPAKLIRQRYKEAAEIIRKGNMCCLFIRKELISQIVNDKQTKNGPAEPFIIQLNGSWPKAEDFFSH